MSGAEISTPIASLLQRFNDAWDSGDPERLQRAAAEAFAPGCPIGPPGEETMTIEALLPYWIEEQRVLNPMVHTIVNVIEGGGVCAWEYAWTAKHSGPLTVPDGRTFAPTGLELTNRAIGIARAGDDGRIASAEQLFSTYDDVILALEAATGTAA